VKDELEELNGKMHGDSIMVNDGETWSRKHRLIHTVQELLDLSNKASANLSGLPEKTLTEIVAKIVKKFDEKRREGP